MKNKIENEEISCVLNDAIKLGLINRDDTSLVFYDLTFIKEKFEEVNELFPAGTLHASAVKANPLISVLKQIKEFGAGVEAASLPEVYLAEKTGFEKNKIVFDSPSKTMKEIEYALNLGINVNADSLDEIEIMDKILSAKKSSSVCGLRVNPQVGTGKILITSVAGDYSKFGVPVNEYTQEIINAYLKYEWLTAIHLHVGSQGCPLDLLLKGVDVVYNLTLEINSLLKKENKKRQINVFDIGGGVPVKYRAGDNFFSVSEYAAALKEKFPSLFDGTFKLITEFGRYYFANSSFAISRIDNIKRQKGITTIVSHLGADFFIRLVYAADNWHHDISMANKNGIIKSGISEEKYVIGGPLCFGGDVIAKEIFLPAAVKGDYLIFHDTGAYTYSMWSRYNSRQMPKVIGYINSGEEFIILKERETLEKVFQFWS